MSVEFIITFFVVFAFLTVLLPIMRTICVKNKIRKLANNVLEVTPKEFFKIRNSSNGGRGRGHISTKHDFAGVYILYNQTKKMYYIGQGKKLFQRVNSHFTGHGNGDVYADYKYGDKFTIKMIALEGSGFSTLNELERNAIRAYNAYSKGYNKTRGNKG